MKFIHNCRACNSDKCTFKPSIIAPFLVERMFDMVPQPTKHLYGVPNQVNYFPCKTMKCSDCGFCGINIMFDDEEMNNLYLNYREDEYNRVRLKYEPEYKCSTFNERHAYVNDVSDPFINSHIKDVDTLIDFGGYDGLNTPNIGKNRYVYDICNVESKVPITDTLFNCDLMTCMHVLEHVPDPNKIIEEMKGFSKYYYFEVPKEKTENKEFWHEHINCFTMESFSNLLSKHFKIIAKKEDKFLHVLCENI